MQGQIIRLSGGASVGDAGWRGARSVGQRELHGDRGASVEICSRAAGIADHVELGISPDLRDVDHTIFGAEREGSGSIAENDYVVAAGSRRPGERQLTKLRNRHIVRGCEYTVDDAIARPIALKWRRAVQ